MTKTLEDCKYAMDALMADAGKLCQRMDGVTSTRADASYDLGRRHEMVKSGKVPRKFYGHEFTVPLQKHLGYQTHHQEAHKQFLKETSSGHQAGPEWSAKHEPLSQASGAEHQSNFHHFANKHGYVVSPTNGINMPSQDKHRKE